MQIWRWQPNTVNGVSTGNLTGATPRGRPACGDK